MYMDIAHHLVRIIRIYIYLSTVARTRWRIRTRGAYILYYIYIQFVN